VSGTIRRIEEATDLVIHGEHIRPLITHAMGSPIEVCEQTGPKGSGPPPHRHPWDEIFVVLDGEVEVSVGDDRVTRIGAGSIVHVPAGTGHSFRLMVDDSRMLSITSQGHAVDMFTAIADAPVADFPTILARFGHSRVDGPHQHGWG
jgi:quercetin dioxygenase-like cupin family protein